MAYYHRLCIQALLRFSPVTLFHKLNELSWYQETLRTWVNHLEYRSGGSTLEVGCATGQLTQYLARSGAVAHGIDKSPKMLRKASASNTDGAYFELASALALPYENNRFDYVIAASLLNIVPDPAMVMCEMARVCKPGGKVSVLVPQAGIADKDIVNLADDLNLSGFSREALMAWHRKAPKMQTETLLEYFSHAGLHKISRGLYLDGMVLTVTGIRQ